MIDINHMMIELLDITTCLQRNGDGCGLYSIANAYQLCARLDPTTCSGLEVDM